MFRTVGDRPALWESLLPAEVLRLPEELARVDALLDDPAFFAPFAPHFHPVLGRPSTPVERYLRLMFLKFRYRLGYESLCAEVSDSISWRRFCRIPVKSPIVPANNRRTRINRSKRKQGSGWNGFGVARVDGAPGRRARQAGEADRLGRGRQAGPGQTGSAGTDRLGRGRRPRPGQNEPHG